MERDRRAPSRRVEPGTSCHRAPPPSAGDRDRATPPIRGAPRRSIPAPSLHPRTGRRRLPRGPRARERRRTRAAATVEVGEPGTRRVDQAGHVALGKLAVAHQLVRERISLVGVGVAERRHDLPLADQVVERRGLLVVEQVRALVALLHEPEVADVDHRVVARRARADHDHPARGRTRSSTWGSCPARGVRTRSGAASSPRAPPRSPCRSAFAPSNQPFQSGESHAGGTPQ